MVCSTRTRSLHGWNILFCLRLALSVAMDRLFVSVQKAPPLHKSDADDAKGNRWDLFGRTRATLEYCLKQTERDVTGLSSTLHSSSRGQYR